MVVNYGEGVVKEWEHSQLRQIFNEESDAIARCVLDTIADTDLDAPCGCAELRKPSLLTIPDERPGSTRPAAPRDDA
jgi:5'-methylthioadenosine phosphorylase